MNRTTAESRVGDFQMLETAHGLETWFLPTRQFKTILVKIHLRTPLDSDGPARSLVPNLLRRGSRRHPTMVEVSRALESLFGAVWHSASYKLGDQHYLTFRLEVPDARFLPGQSDLLPEGLDLLRELLFEPRLEDGGFPPAVFEQERLNQRREVEAQFNDKMGFAFRRLIEEMYPGDPYGQPVLGHVEDVDALTRDAALRCWQHLVSATPARVYVVGAVEPPAVLAWLDQHLPLPSAPLSVPTAHALEKTDQPQVVVEQQPVSQSKLLVGYPVDLHDLDERSFDALRLLASVLGGGFHSRLFQSVRERHSLAYFASASIDRFRGALITSFGIDAADRPRVQELLDQELDSLRREPPSELELEQSRRLAVTATRTVRDSANGMVEVLDAGLAHGRPRALDAICRSLERVSGEDVLRAAARVGPARVVYCLEGAAQHDAS